MTRPAGRAGKQPCPLCVMDAALRESWIPSTSESIGTISADTVDSIYQEDLLCDTHLTAMRELLEYEDSIGADWRIGRDVLDSGIGGR